MPTVKPELVRCRYGNDANLIGALKLFFEQNPPEPEQNRIGVETYERFP